ncbi:MAG: terminase, partial [Alphaproteobacteria bacterium]
PHSQLYSAALSRDQAAVIYGLASKCVRMSPDLAPYVTIRETAKQLYCEELGTLYRALSAEASTAFGLSPVFIIHDELGQVRGPRSSLYEALETATGAQQNPLSVIISTQAPTDNDLLSILIDDALKGSDPRVVVSLYTADPEADPFALDAIKAANPAYGDFQNPVEVTAMAEDARRMPAREAEYRNLILNQRVEASSPFIAPSLWKACGGDVAESFEGYSVYAGLDLSEVNDLTSLVMIAEIDGVWHVKPVFWLPAEGLEARARADRVPYDLWRDKGFIETTPGNSVSYEYVAEYLRDLFDKLTIERIAFDRWNWRHLRPWLVTAGMGESDLERFAEFGQGYKSMSPALRDLEAALLDQRIAHGNHPVLAMCAANAVVESDTAGNKKLTKKRSTGRIDGMIALAMALSIAVETEGPSGPSVYEERGALII